MKRILSAVLVAGLSISGLALAQSQQPAPQQPSKQQSSAQHDGHQSENAKKPPRKGERLADGRGTRVSDYNRHKLKAPPKGQEWRKVDDKFVLVKITTGIIQQIVDGGH